MKILGRKGRGGGVSRGTIIDGKASARSARTQRTSYLGEGNRPFLLNDPRRREILRGQRVRWYTTLIHDFSN